MNHVNLFLDIFGLAFLFFHALLCRWSYTRRKKPSLAYRIMIILISVFLNRVTDERVTKPGKAVKA